MDLWLEVRRHVLVDGHSKRSACRKFGLHWRTVQKILDHAEPPGYRRRSRRPRKIDRFVPVIHEMLESDRKAPRKQRHTARRIFDRLRDEYGFDGKLTIVKDAVRAWRRVHAKTFVPLAHPPGEAQVDFGHAKFYLNGEETEAALFVMSLPYSDALFVQAYPRECTETFQDGHVRAFEFFGGVPTRISYDNSRIAIKKLAGAHARELTDGFLRLASHYLFQSHFCRIKRPNEKGHVENLVGYGRRNFLVPPPKVRDFEQLNLHLRERCRADLDRQVRGKSGIKAVRLEEDVEAFRPLPGERFEAHRVELATANSLSLVRFQCNDYSVPTAWAHHRLTVIGTVRSVRIVHDDEVVAEHTRIWNRARVSYDPVHYLALLERRPGAFDTCKPTEDWDLPPSFGILRRRLEADWGRGKGMRQFIQVLRLLEDASLAQLKRAVHQALELGAVTPDAIRVILEGQSEEPVAVFCLDGRPHLTSVHVAAPDLSAYGDLLDAMNGGVA